MNSDLVVDAPHVAGPLRLHPFRALSLAPSRIGDIASGHAFARPYRSVAARLGRWEARGQLHHDDEPALYLHEYTANGITVRGLVGALDLSRRAARPEDGVVLPHEGIHPGQAEDLADRMAEMQMNPAPILLVQRAAADTRERLASVRRTDPWRVFTDRGEQHHRIWAIRDPQVQLDLAAAIAPSRALIADGHHRYAAYLRLQERQRGAAERGLAMLVDHDDTPLFLGPIHRVVPGAGLDDLRTAAESVGAAFVPAPAEAAIAGLAPTTLVATDGARWATVSLRVPDDQAAVEVLHGMVLPALPRPTDRLTYHHTVDSALAHAVPGEQLALLLPAPDVDLVLRIVRAGRVLPEKATSFQPKPNPGALIRSLRDE